MDPLGNWTENEEDSQFLLDSNVSDPISTRDLASYMYDVASEVAAVDSNSVEVKQDQSDEIEQSVVQSYEKLKEFAVSEDVVLTDILISRLLLLCEVPSELISICRNGHVGKTLQYERHCQLLLDNKQYCCNQIQTKKQRINNKFIEKNNTRVDIF